MGSVPMSSWSIYCPGLAVETGPSQAAIPPFIEIASMPRFDSNLAADRLRPPAFQ
jgi:hypothetical protein